MLDFDEMLVSIKNSQIRKYLGEAIKSYSIGNYRSAILAVWVATMFDLVQKFKILVEQREPTAIGEWNNGLGKNIEDHKNWELELIRAAKKIDMISRYEADTLESLSKTRNRYAHPSFDEIGILFDPTPEEVRYFIRTLYDIVLSQPAQLGSFYVGQLIESIKSPNFFVDKPIIDQLTELREIVIEKVRLINSRQIPRLLKNLFQDLNSPSSQEHKLNIICFLVNIWGSKSDFKFAYEISDYWDEYIVNQEIDNKILEGILNYPKCINEISEKAQEKVGSRFKHEFFVRPRNSSESAIKFLASSDIVPLVQKVLEDAPNLISMDRLTQRSDHYKDLFGDKFSEVFGKQILIETRKLLRTCDGHKVNPAISLLCDCKIWDLANTLTEVEQKLFAIELVYSINSSNWGTMALLNFDNRLEIPIKWTKLIFNIWTEELSQKKRIQSNLSSYLGHYLGLFERFTNETNDYKQSEEIIQILNRFASEDITKLESNKELLEFWYSLIGRNNTIASKLIEEQ